MGQQQPHNCACFLGKCWRNHCPQDKTLRRAMHRLVEPDVDTTNVKDGRSYKIFEKNNPIKARNSDDK